MYKGKHPMTCSRFTAQCFIDAGLDFPTVLKNWKKE
jgi:hypothetical protein